MNENQRVRLSKKMLKESLIRLLNEESIHKISVREICDEAQINRTTFYKHYGSPYDLLGDMEDDVLTQIDSYLSTNNKSFDNSLKRLIQMISFVNDNLDLCRVLFNNNVDPEFPEKLINLPPIKQMVTQLMGKNNEDEIAYIFGFVVNGGFSIIRKWMNKDSRETPEEMAALINRTIMKLFPVSASL